MYINWKAEGFTDLCAITKAILEHNCKHEHSAWTTGFGAKEDPLHHREFLESFAGEAVYIVHDCDKPGQEGATYVESGGNKRMGWAPAAKKFGAKVVKNIVLPYPIEETRGKDLRDYLREHSWQDLLDLAAATPEWTGDIKTYPNLAVNDPGRLADLNLKKYETSGRKLKFWRGNFYQWKGRCYSEIPLVDLRSKLHGTIEEEFHRANVDDIEEDAEKAGEAHKVSRSLVGNVVEATQHRCLIKKDVKVNTWLPDAYSDDRKQRRVVRPYISMENGILDIEAVLREKIVNLIPHSPNWFSLVSLPYEYDPRASCEKWIAFLKRNIQDPKLIMKAQEWAGYLLQPDTSYQKFLICEGEGANGKSVYFAAMEAMLGQENCSHVPLENFGDRFALVPTIGKLANISTDAAEIDKAAEGQLKAFTSGDIMNIDRKNQAPVEMAATARLMVACNNRPRFADKTDAVWRRMEILPFMHIIPPEERVYGMDKPSWWEDQGELPGILNWALIGLRRLREMQRFTRSPLADEVLADYREENNPASIFLGEHCSEHASAKVKCSELFRSYKAWAIENGYRTLNAQNFGKEVKRKFRKSRVERIGGREERARYYVGIIFSHSESSGNPEDENELF